MSWLDRVSAIANGIGGAIHEAAGFGADVITALDPTELEEFPSTVWQASLHRGGKLLENVVGPDEGVGALIGGLPESVRIGPRGLLHAIDVVSDEVIEEPLTTLMTMASIGDRPGGPGTGVWLSPSQWSEAYKIAQTRSLGQSVALAIGTRDILDPKEVADAAGSDWFNLVSGTVDFAKVMRLDADVIAGEAFATTRFLRARHRWNTYMQSKEWDEIATGLSRIDDAVGRHEFLRRRVFRQDTPDADRLSALLARAETRSERDLAMRALRGDGRAVAALQDEAAGLARSIADMHANMTGVRSTSWAPTFNGSSHARRLVDEFRAATDDLSRTAAFDNLERNLEILESGVALTAREPLAAPALVRDLAPADGGGLAGRIERHSRRIATYGETPTLRFAGSRRLADIRDGLYQTSPWFKPIRVITNKRPVRRADPKSGDFDIQMDRWLREMGASDEVRAAHLHEFAAAPAAARAGSALNIIEAHVKRLARQNDLDKNELEVVIEAMRASNTELRDWLTENQAFAHIPSKGEDAIARTPLFTSQTEEAVFLPDARVLSRELRRYGARKRRWGSVDPEEMTGFGPTAAAARLHAEMLDEALKGVTSVWRTTVLLRGAFPIRATGLDEGLRIIAKMGALTAAGEQLRRGVPNLVRSTLDTIGLRTGEHAFAKAELAGFDLAKAGRAAERQHWKSTKNGMLAGAGVGFITAGVPGAIVGGAAGGGAANGLVRWLDDLHRAGYTGFGVTGNKINAAISNPQNEAQIRAQLGASQQLRAFVSGHETRLMERYASNANWTSILPENRQQWRKAIDRALNRQIRNDALARRILNGDSRDEALDWLLNTAEGRLHRRALRVKARQPEAWVDEVYEVVHTYIPDEALRRRLGAGETVRALDLEAAVADDLLPVVHGQEIIDVIGLREAVWRRARNAVDGFFDWAGSFSDELVRIPHFRALYRSEMRRVLAGRGEIGPADLSRIEHEVRRYALAETKKIAYDYASRSEFGDLMSKIMMPFFPAWQEAIAKWASLTVDNPTFTARASKILLGEIPEPVATTDDQGRTFFTFRIPEFAKGILQHSPLFRDALESFDTLAVDRDMLNMVSQPPGFGPFVQLAASPLARENPRLEDVLDFVLPYGPVDVVSAFEPATVRRLNDALSSDEESRGRAYDMHLILMTKLIEMSTGERPKIDFGDGAAVADLMEEVEREAWQLSKLKFAVGFIAPAMPRFDSPYKPYMDAWREIRSKHPANAERVFLDTYGEEFFWATSSLTRSNDGVPATLEGLEARDEFSDLINRHPELGSFIVGTDAGSGARYSRLMYDRQHAEPLRPGSATKQRERLSNEEQLTTNDASLGWVKFRQKMDLIEAVRVERGLPNLSVKAAADLKAAKDLLIADLAEEHPHWWREYATVDRDSWRRRIAGFRDVLTNPKIAARDGSGSLARYLAAREEILTALESRKATSLDARSNADVRFAWESFVSDLVEQDVEFAHIYYRWLQSDPMTQDTRSLAA